jgi:hypothetical protein
MVFTSSCEVGKQEDGPQQGRPGGTFEHMSETCAATHISPTATGDREVRCAKDADHVERGDDEHEGRLGVFPVRWRDDQQPS